jgi:hypothetical protein
MKIELTARWTKIKEDKRSAKERREEERLRRLLSKEGDDDYNNEEDFHKHAYFAYDPVTLDTHDIIGWNKFDEEHTTVRTDQGVNYIVKTNYETFSTFWAFITGETPKKPEQFQFGMEVPYNE